MPRLPDPRIPWFLGAQSFTVNLEVSPKHPPILWKLPVQSFPIYRNGIQNTSSNQDSKITFKSLDTELHPKRSYRATLGVASHGSLHLQVRKLDATQGVEFPPPE